MKEWRLRQKEKKRLEQSQTPKRKKDGENQDDEPPKKKPKDMTHDEYKEHRRYGQCWD